MRPAIMMTLYILAVSPAAAIVGNAPTHSGSSPPVVMITGASGFCTGALIARDLVLTAAHCVPPGSDYKLIEFDAKRQPLLRDSRAVMRHPQFNPRTFSDHRATADVALIKLALPLAKQPAVIAGERPAVNVGDRFVVTGYGLSETNNGKTGGTLRTANLIATGKPGNLQLRLFDPQTRGERAGLGACTGDSGAPVFVRANDTLAIVGVVSWSTDPNNGEGCGGLTGVTPLTLYRNWIIETARKLGSPLTP